MWWHVDGTQVLQEILVEENGNNTYARVQVWNRKLNTACFIL